ncbi:hypothetical protein B188_10000 [Candidatus Brocadiaceae bacterium B188]|nr:hypothetical protein B188_10000 [Candidatus Brocadiaceae bacterium B188]
MDKLRLSMRNLHNVVCKTFILKWGIDDSSPIIVHAEFFCSVIKTEISTAYSYHSVRLWYVCITSGIHKVYAS